MSPPEIAQSLDWFDRSSPEERRAFIVGFISALGLVTFLAGVLWKWLIRGLLEEIRILKERLAGLEADNDSLRARNGDLQHRVAGGEGHHQKLQAELATLSADCEVVKVEKARLQHQLEHWEGIGQKVDSLTDLDVPLWFTKPKDTPVPFVPLGNRHTRIVSVFNLKGGVGKTTITANLAAVISQRHPAPRILLIDADWQGSLTALCTDGEAGFGALVQNGHLLHRIIEADSVPQNPHMHLHHVGAGHLPNTRLLGANGTLSQVEDAILVRWVADRLKHDPRFILRQWLHHDPHAEDFDLVLIDCPPRLTAASVAALASSDELLIPVIPDDLSSSAVTILLRSLREHAADIAPHLHVAGIWPNLARHGPHGLIGNHVAALNALATDASQAWCTPINVWTEDYIRPFTAPDMNRKFPGLGSQVETFRTVANRVFPAAAP